MSENKHQMKLRHKAEIKALRDSASKSGKGAAKKLKQDEADLIAKQEKELQELDKKMKQEEEEQGEEAGESQTGKATEGDGDGTGEAIKTYSNETAAIASSVSSTSISAVSSASSSSSSRPLVPSRAQKKKAAKAAKEAARRLEIEVSVSQMKDPKKEEADQLDDKLKQEKLRVEEIIADGHCLYRAIANQLKINGEEIAKLIAKESASSSSSSSSPSSSLPPYLLLRHLASSHIRSHLSSFSPYLVDHQTGDPLLEEKDQLNYCESLLRENEDIVWGGHMEIVALAEALKKKIIVYSALGKEQRIGGREGEGEGEEDKKKKEQGQENEDEEADVIRVSFHQHYYGLGDHYNAVVKRKEEEEDEEEQGEDAQ